METALLMHRRAVELNEQHSTVLAEARACGWLHWRPSPSTGILQLSSSQPWADQFTEGSSRMDSSFREDRNSWVPLGVPDPVSALTAPQREELVSFWNDPQPLVVEAEQDLMDELDLRRPDSLASSVGAERSGERFGGSAAVPDPETEPSEGRLDKAPKGESLRSSQRLEGGAWQEERPRR